MVEVIWTLEANQMREDILRIGYERFGALYIIAIYDARRDPSFLKRL